MVILLLVLGLLVTCVGGIMLLVAAFRRSVGWGLAVFFLPFANLVFTIANWREARTSFLVQLAGVVMLGGGIVLAPSALVEAGMPNRAATQSASDGGVYAAAPAAATPRDAGRDATWSNEPADPNWGSGPEGVEIDMSSEVEVEPDYVQEFNSEE